MSNVSISLSGDLGALQGSCVIVDDQGQGKAYPISGDPASVFANVAQIVQSAAAPPNPLTAALGALPADQRNAILAALGMGPAAPAAQAQQSPQASQPGGPVVFHQTR